MLPKQRLILQIFINKTIILNITLSQTVLHVLSSCKFKLLLTVVNYCYR